MQVKKKSTNVSIKTRETRRQIHDHSKHGEGKKKSLEETSNDNTQDCESMETEDTNYVPDERGDEFKKVTRILVKRTIVIVNNSKAVRNLQHHFILSVNITHI